MKRTEVQVQREGYGSLLDYYFQLGTVTVKARCEKCVFYDQLQTGGQPQDQGKCHLNPKTTLKDEHDWCSKFKPDVDKL